MKRLFERENYLKTAQEAADKLPNNETETIRWRDKKLVKNIIRVDANYLMYRIDNSRTRRQQLRYLNNHPDLNRDFFNDPESAEVQKAQETILLEMIHSTGKDFVEDLNIRGQDRSAIITFEGYLVNGNRRTAALKSIGVEYIECVMLPEDATKKDIYALEQELQISQDFKEDYHWINELINFHEGIYDKHLEFDKDQMAKRLRIKRSDLDARLRMLELVDQFLIWKGIPNQYDYEKLDQTEEAFIQLEKATKKIKLEQERQELMKAIFVLIENPPEVGRLYKPVGDLIRDWNIIYKRILERQQNPNSNDAPLPITETNKTEDAEILDGLSDEDQNSNPVQEIFNDSENSEDMASLILETIADVKAENKELKEAEAVYEGVSAALRELQGLVVDSNSTKLKASASKLYEIIKISNKLLEQIKNN